MTEKEGSESEEGAKKKAKLHSFGKKGKRKGKKDREKITIKRQF